MSGVRVLVGTRKGAFVLTADGKRDRWEVSGPHFGGWEIYHLTGSSLDPNRLYASQSNGWFGQMIQRSDDGGATWAPVGHEWEALTNGLPQRDCYVNVLRDAMAVDALDACGVYVGTTGGQVYASADGGDSWTPIVRDLPAVLSVEAQTLP